MASSPLSFAYQEYPLLKQGSRGEPSSMRPVLDIKKGDVVLKAMVDSGADYSVSFRQIGETIGIDFTQEKATPSHLAGLHRCNREDCELNPNRLKSYRKPLSFKMGEKEVTLNVSWIDRKFNPETDFMLLLGRDFFDYFDILFKQRDEQFVLFPHEV